MSLVPGKDDQGKRDSVIEALLKISDGGASSSSEPSTTSKPFDKLVVQGREDLQRQELISAYLQKLGLIQKGLVERQRGSKPEDYFLEGIRQVIAEPIGAALIQNLLEDFPLPQTAATDIQSARQQGRLTAQPGIKSPEEWAAFQTLTVLGAFNLEQAGKIVKPDPKNLGPAYIGFKQGNNRGAVVNILRPIITRVLPK